MNILIQPLKNGQAVGDPTPDTLPRFLTANDGFSIQEASNMRAILAMGSGYLIGGGMGEYKLTMVKDST